MKGIILAGGLGTRLRPMTLVTNKHLLPVYDQPMVYFPIKCLVNAGITEIMIVTGEENAGDFIKLLRNGKDLGLTRIEYAFQVGEGGIADALKLGQHFVGNDKVCVTTSSRTTSTTPSRISANKNPAPRSCSKKWTTQNALVLSSLVLTARP